jgi:hypothetical protein
MAYDNLGKKTQGKDFNFFQRMTVSSATFGDHPDMVVTFTTQGIMFMNEGSGVIEVSFNGNTVHTELNSGDSSKVLTFNDRVVSMIWFRVKTGGPSIPVRVEAWSTH